MSVTSAITLQDVYHALASLHKRERRRRLIALIGGQAQMARVAKVDRATVCRVVAGWTGGEAVERTEHVIRESLRQLSNDLEGLWDI
jgi:aminoglycoside phosphotransferase family enzyme